jgi:hypothetical protein
MKCILNFLIIKLSTLIYIYCTAKAALAHRIFLGNNFPPKVLTPELIPVTET